MTPYDSARPARGSSDARLLGLVLAILIWIPGVAAAQRAGYQLIPLPNDDAVALIYPLFNGFVPEVPVPGAPWSVAAHPDGLHACVVQRDDNAVAVIDILSRTVVSSIPVGTTPVDVAITLDGARAYVANSGSASVSAVDLASNTVVATIPVAGSASGIVMTPDGLRAVVVTGASLTLIDVTTDTIVGSIPLTHPGDRVAIRPDGLRAYVSLPAFDEVAVVDLAGATQILSIPVGNEPRGLAVSPNAVNLWVANFGDASISMIDVASNSVTGTLSGPQHPTAPLGVAFYSNAMVSVSDFAGNAVRTYLLNAARGGPITGHGWATGPAFLAMGPNLISGVCEQSCPPATVVTSDDSLTAGGYGTRFVALHAGGTLITGANWTTTRTISLLPTQPVSGYFGTSGYHATLNGDIINGGRLVKQQSGTLTIAGPHIDADFTVQDGALEVATTVPGTVDVTAVLSGTGTIGTINAIVGAISPGSGAGTAPGVLRAGQVTFAARARFVAQIDGPAAGTGYDRLEVSGTATLNLATLEVQAGYAPAPGATFTILTHASGTFAGLPEGVEFVANSRVFRISYHGGGGSDVVLTYLRDNFPPTLSPLPTLVVESDASDVLDVPLTVGDDGPLDALVLTATSSHQELVPNSGLSFSGTGASRTLRIARNPDVSGLTNFPGITVTVSDGMNTIQRSFAFGVGPRRFYYVPEGSTGGLFSTEIALANPNPVAAPIDVTFFKDDGTSVRREMTLPPTSRTTVRAADIPGLESATFSTHIGASGAKPLFVERTMWWDASGYGASMESARALDQNWRLGEQYFAEGSQGFFHTYYLLLNPYPNDTTATVTFITEDGPEVQRTYPVPAHSRVTIDAGAIPELMNRSFGAVIRFRDYGYSERAMYFGEAPLFDGGSVTSAAWASSDWYLAEGATGTFFDTFLMIMNPTHDPRTVQVDYLPSGGAPVRKTYSIPGRRRLTINVANEDATLANAAVAMKVTADYIVTVERSQYWPHGGWNESHTSAGYWEYPRTRWGLAEGRVGGANGAQTYILVYNTSNEDADITATFLRADGTTLVKRFTAGPNSRFNIGITGGASSAVPELANEFFSAVIDATQPVVVEHSLYFNANGVTWAAGANAVGMPWP